MTLGETLVVMRDMRSMTLRDLAVRSGVSNPNIHQIESGKIKDPGFRTIIRICDALGIDVNELANIVSRIR